MHKTKSHTAVPTRERLRRMYRDFARLGITLIELDADMPQLMRNVCFPNVNIFLVPDDMLPQARTIALCHGLSPRAEFTLLPPTKSPYPDPLAPAYHVLQYNTNRLEAPNLEVGRLFLVALSVGGVSKEGLRASPPLNVNDAHVCPVLRPVLGQARVALCKIVFRMVQCQRDKMRNDYAELFYKCLFCAVSYVILPRSFLAKRPRSCRGTEERPARDGPRSKQSVMS